MILDRYITYALSLGLFSAAGGLGGRISAWAFCEVTHRLGFMYTTPLSNSKPDVSPKPSSCFGANLNPKP